MATFATPTVVGGTPHGNEGWSSQQKECLHGLWGFLLAWIGTIACLDRHVSACLYAWIGNCFMGLGFCGFENTVHGLGCVDLGRQGAIYFYSRKPPLLIILPTP